MDHQRAHATWWIPGADQWIEERRSEAVGYTEERPGQGNYGHKRHNEDVKCP